MEQKRAKLDRDALSCLICLDLLSDPVTTSCEHSYCTKCIKSFWDTEDDEGLYSCPQCGQIFKPRPVLAKNTTLADLVEGFKNNGVQTDHCNAEAEDVDCDFCTGTKLKANKSCLVCLVSLCEQHLQPHFELPIFEKHKLVAPSKKLQENVCSRHSEVMKMFCRTDQQCICYLCPVDEHKDHDTVSAVAERTERQKELEENQQTIQQRLQDRKKEVMLLQPEMEAINCSADKAVEDSEKIFTELIRFIEKRSAEVKEQIRSQQKSEVSRVTELRERMEQEIAELKRNDAELTKLLHTEDHNQFLHNYPSLAPLSEPTDSSSINIRPLSYFEGVTAAVSEVREKLQDFLSETWTNISLAVTDVDVLLSHPEPQTRAEFLKCSQKITLDPNTAHPQVSVWNRGATFTKDQHSYSSHQDRFTSYRQVLSRESLIGRRYLEVQWSGIGVRVAVTYKDISRTGGFEECQFGYNDKSWALSRLNKSLTFHHNNVCTHVSGPCSSKVGVYLDHSRGLLSFYSVSKTMTLLHRVQTTFTQPLYVGFCFNYSWGDSATFCELNSTEDV
ncbi:tripartite motif-containing protein 16 [Etheostoma spectabile]|uniref:tripartite motif-containing protein 16 n=1 Tax=Etheostoma spectabile TaxID=54343 RepID=UPI0013AE962D|nr:tripartite motif-containing protein 16-like [Etheostoma spectabile]